MNKMNIKKLSIMITILSVIITGVTFLDLNTRVFAVTNREFDSTYLPNNKKANQWQIVSGEYDNKHYEYGIDHAVRVQKNVISTDEENKFQMLLNIEPQVTWAEIMQMNTILIGNNASGQINKQTVYLYPEKGNRPYLATLVYYRMNAGKKIIISENVMYHDGKVVKNGYVSYSNTLFGGKFKGFLSYDFSGNNDRIEIDLSNLMSEYTFLDYKPTIQNVEDQMGDFINFDEVVTVDGTTQLKQKNPEILEWNIENKDSPLEYDRNETTGEIIPKGVEEVKVNGKTTYFRRNYYRMLYRLSLDIEHKDFKSYNNYEANHSAILNYKVGDTESSATFEVPVVRGLLYDVLINKVDSETNRGLEGAEFTLTRNNMSTKEISNSNGKIEFINNRTGTYWLEETLPPKGYKIIDKTPISILMNYTQLVLEKKASGEPNRNQRNNYELPSITVKNEMELGILKIKKKLINADPIGNDSFQVQIRGITDKNSHYQQDIVIKDGEEITLFVPKGTYTINEIVPMEYSATIDFPNVSISSNNYEHTTTIENNFNHVGYFHDEDRQENIFKEAIE